MVPELKVVNHHAERSVVLIQEYCGLKTMDEQQLQFLLIIVQEHQKQISDCRKKT